MKLPYPALDLATQLLEFDVWITPSLEEIRDTEMFTRTMDDVVEVFDILAEATSDFADLDACGPEPITRTFLAHANDRESVASIRLLRGLASVLFLVTGKSDNNAKCQFPVRVASGRGYPSVVRGSLVFRPVPRTLDEEKVMTTATGLASFPEEQTLFVKEYVAFLLSDQVYVGQLFSIGKSYVMLKSYGRERDLLSPLVVFKVRGSVSASGGHRPEAALRLVLEEWGLVPDVDFNLLDTIVAKLPGMLKPLEGDEQKNVVAEAKTRAYDFVLPFKTEGWTPQILVQCQFYAGDSGSVSHKNVDQTRASRESTKQLLPEARFVEYVDGAGYFSSLNGDLKRLLAMADTASFIQLRTAGIRLRREFQQVGFLVPIDLEHAILCTDGSRGEVERLLLADGFEQEEIQRCISQSLDRHLVAQGKGGRLDIQADRREIARRYFLLDVAAIHGEVLDPSSESLNAYFLVPGYGPFYGIKTESLVLTARTLAPSLLSDWSLPEVVIGDIGKLSESGTAICN